MSESIDISKYYLDDVIINFQKTKLLAERSIKQVRNDADLFWLPDGESNSVAILVKHITGNMRSRWTNIFTEDGEKADRNRPEEFDQKYTPSRAELLELWENGWSYLFITLKSLNPEDLLKEIYIRKESHTVLKAIQRQLTHYAIHIGQITFLSKQIEWKNWKSLSIPRNGEVFDYKEIEK